MLKEVLSEVESEAFDELQERLAKNFMDVVVLMELRNGPLSGYCVIRLIHKKFDMLVSSGTVYTLLYCLERRGLIKCHLNYRRRDYVLTQKGKETVRAIISAREKTRALMHILL